MTVTSLPAEFSSSLLLLASNDLEADLKKPDDPFVFSGRRFIAKPEARFDAKDGLIYAIRVYNPAVDPAKKSMFLKEPEDRRRTALHRGPGPRSSRPVPDQKAEPVIDLAGFTVDENLGEYSRGRVRAARRRRPVSGKAEVRPRSRSPGRRSSRPPRGTEEATRLSIWRRELIPNRSSPSDRGDEPEVSAVFARPRRCRRPWRVPRRRVDGDSSAQVGSERAPVSSTAPKERSNASFRRSRPGMSGRDRDPHPNGDSLRPAPLASAP
jgi:hypothetical protein